MSVVPIEIAEIGFSESSALSAAIAFANANQNYFSFSLLVDPRFRDYEPENAAYYRTDEIYSLLDNVLIDIKGFHNLIIGVVDGRLDGKKWGNLFGSMETNKNDRITGKAVASIHGVKDIISPIPISVYYCFELLSFSIRFIVGKGMIHDGERGCLFHRKANKADIVESIQSGYISLDSLRIINKYLEFEQIQCIQGMLIKLAHISRSDNPEIALQRFRKDKSMSSSMKVNPSVFISYSHADSEWLKRVQIHLKPLERKGLILPWDDTKIEPGMQWKDEINKALDSARVAILLISADFLASDFIVDNELPPLLASAEEHGTLIFPVILKPCLFSESEL
jgi:hypothetical protein